MTPRPELEAADRATAAAAAAAGRWLDNHRRVASRTLSQPQLDRLLRDALAAIARLLEADAASLLLANDEGTELVGRAAFGLHQDLDLEVSVPSGVGVSGQVLATGEARFIDDLAQVKVVGDVLRTSGQRSYVGVPVTAGGARFGVLHATRSALAPFTAADATLLRRFAEPLAAAIERVRLFSAEHQALATAEAAKVAAQRATERVRGLQRVTATLAGAATVEEVARVIVDGTIVWGPPASERAVWVQRHGTLHLVAASERRLQGEIGPGDLLPAVATSAPGEPMFVETREEVVGRWPALAEGDIGAFALLPLVVEERSLGVVAVGLHHDHRFDRDEREYLGAIAEQGALALARAESRAALDEARRLAEERQHQLDFLAEASDRLGRSLDLDLTLESVADLAVPRLTDRCALYLLEGDEITKRVIGPSLTDDEWELFHSGQERIDALSGVGAVIRSGVAHHVAHVDDAELARTVRSAERRDLLERVGIGGLLILPLRARGRAIGALAFVNRRGRRMDDKTVALAGELSARAAVAIDNAEMFRRESHVAGRLIESLLPGRLPEVTGLELAVTYHPSRGGPQVGGDFYDAIAVDERVVLLAIGDVQGKGVEAAALTGLARTTIETAAQFTTSPPVILGHLNTSLIGNIVGRAAAAEHPWDDARLCTAAIVRLERRGRRWRASTASAGHPLPLVRRADGTVQRACQPALMLGVEPGASYSASVLDLRPGDSLVLVTDGVTESTTDDGPLGADGVAAILAGCDGPASATTAALAEVALASPGPHDDLVVLTARARPRS